MAEEEADAEEEERWRMMDDVVGGPRSVSLDVK